MQALGLSRSSDYLYFYIANCYYKLGKLKRSIEYYEKTLEYHPKHLETLINLTICFLETNNGKDALRKARSAYQTDRESRKVILIYALADLKCGIYSDAIEKADILLSRNEEDTEAKLIKIHALICLRKAKDAINILDTLNEGIKTSEIFIFLSYLTYKILVEENQSDYNKNMLKLYMDKIEEIDTETIQETGLIDYILKK